MLSIFNPAPLILGSISFEKIDAISATSALDYQKDDSKIKPASIKIVAWLVDNSQFGNFHTFDIDRTKEDKDAELEQLFRRKASLKIVHEQLNGIGIKYVVINRIERQYLKSLIIVSMDLEEDEDTSLDTKSFKRKPAVLSDGTKAADTTKAVETKSLQGSTEKVHTNSLLKNLDDMLGKLGKLIS